MLDRSLLPPRFWAKVTNVRPGRCWRWRGPHNNFGYGIFHNQGSHTAHRFAYERLIGPVPPGMELDHLCGHHWCVNPRHLEPVTHSENIRRDYERGTRVSPNNNRAKTHCKYGHEFTQENTRITPNGSRACRACHRKWGREQRSKHR